MVKIHLEIGADDAYESNLRKSRNFAVTKTCSALLKQKGTRFFWRTKKVRRKRVLEKLKSGESFGIEHMASTLRKKIILKKESRLLYM